MLDNYDPSAIVMIMAVLSLRIVLEDLNNDVIDFQAADILSCLPTLSHFGLRCDPNGDGATNVNDILQILSCSEASGD